MMLAREPPRINLTCSSIAPESLRLHALAIDLAFQSVSSLWNAQRVFDEMTEIKFLMHLLLTYLLILMNGELEAFRLGA
ncbi:hypothetical protein HanIR_Chr16g0798661 [Helianthus annuus]|nr:hypothetical protein HanIR_Chr16g0798661 [Helianthus annuus]